MAAERTPQNQPSLIAPALVALARLAVRYPWVTIGLALVATVVSVVLSATRLHCFTSRAALISQGSEFHQRWLAYIKEFGEEEDVVIAVEGPDRNQIVPVLEDLAARVAREDHLFHSVFHDAIDTSRLRAKGLYYLPLEELEAIDRSLEPLEAVLQGDWSILSPAAMLDALARGLGLDSPWPMGQGAGLSPEVLGSMLGRLTPMCQMLAAALDPGASSGPIWPEWVQPGTLADLATQGLQPSSGRFGFVLLKLAEDRSESFTRHADAIARLRQIVAEARTRYPHLKIGLTGLPVIEHDEMRSSQSSMTVATVLELAGVILVLVAGFGGMRHSLLAMSTLMLGMVWSLGYIAVTVGHLNILSMAFGAILIGLGNNYGIYSVASYLQLRSDHHGVGASIEQTARTVAPGITLGAVSTAAAFFMAGYTEFPGVAELGLVAGGGILLCWLAAMTVLPAMIHLCDARRPDRPLPTPLDFHLWLRPLIGRPRLVLAASAIGTAILAFGLGRLKYDYNLMNLQPLGLESVEWEQRLLQERSAYFALSMADTPQEALQRKERFLRLASVERVEEIASLIPADVEQKRAMIERIGQRLKNLPAEPPRIPVPPQEQWLPLLARLRAVVAADPHHRSLADLLSQLHASLRRMPPGAYYAQVSGYFQRAAEELLGRLHLLREVASPEPPQWSDLPRGLVERFVGRSGRVLLRVYGKDSLWNPQAMRQFVRDVRQIDPQATGNPFQVYEASRLMKRSYEQAALLALFVIVPVVFLDFGTLRETFLAVLPLGLAMIQLFGLMGLLDLPLNPANMIALPLMLGMGIDNGVHVIHDFRTQPGPYRMSHSTAVAVFLDTITTMVGFAVLMLAEHRGLQTLGRSLTLGMACCLFSSAVILPAILVLLTRHRGDAHATEGEAQVKDSSRSLPEIRRRDVVRAPMPAAPVPTEERPETETRRAAA